MKMPKLRPIPIETKDKVLWLRIWIWLTSIRQWEVTENWRCTLPDGTVIVIPGGFVFDGTSIPRPLWFLMSPTGLLFIPSLVHDFAYKYNYLYALSDVTYLVIYKQEVGRKYWDELFKKQCIQVNGMTYIDRIAWLMVTLFGWVAWNKHRQKHPRRLYPMI